MEDKDERGALEQIRAARHRISERFDHDPRKLVEYYIELQQEYEDRLVGAAEKKERKEAA